ncbi:MAG: 5-methylthioadenosine/S-adenosylhomocysteine deaminase [Glaciecola sp.]|jgi:5-methylthioadenosine/S-adenosylhomocysteine deaminase|uniref:amidohydrolase family protein n=1 Tax=Congregibacter sp. TaxID=2744308 RepID=UPI0039E5C75E
MIEADLAITGGELLCMTGQSTGESGTVPTGTVLVFGNRIVAVGSESQIGPYTATKTIDATDQVVMPGFSNCHTHVGSNVLLRGLNEDAKLFEWLQSMWRLKQNFDHETLRLASLAGLAEMALAGITSFNEHFDAYSVTPEIDALKTIPLRATLGYGFADIGLYGELADWSYRALDGFGDIVSRHHNTLDGRLRVALSPHATYSCTDKLWRRCAEVAKEYELTIHTHLSEGQQEHQFVADNHDMTPTAWLHSLGLLAPNLTAAHCTTLTDDDIALMAEHQVKVAHCPISNAKLCSGIMPIRKLMAAGVTVGLATDGPASHNTLDMFQEMKFGAITHKNHHLDPELLTVTDMLEMGTREAAKAMHLDEAGTLAPGQLADIIVVDLNNAHCAPRYDSQAALVYSSRADDVVHTIVNGQAVVENGVLQGLDLGAMLAELRDRAASLRQRSRA